MTDFEKEFRRKLTKQTLELEELRSKNSMQASILESFAGIYWWKDKGGIYKNCNINLAHALGLSSVKDIIGKTDYELPWHEEADILVKNDFLVMESGETLIKEEPVRGKDGQLKIFLVTKAPLKNTIGETIGTVGNSVDITKQKDLEMELKISVEKSEIANEAKSEFIANMSHDLRTPMAGLLGMLEGLLHDEEDARASLMSKSHLSKEKLEQVLGDVLDKMKECVGLAIESGRKINQFHDDILNSIESESGMSKEVELEFNLDSAVQDILSIKRPIAITKKIDLTAEIHENTPCHLKGLKQIFQRILSNLLGNALKFTEEGSVKVIIGLDDDRENNGTRVGSEIVLKIQVKDTGVGIPDDKFDDIFGQFSRLSSSYDSDYKGLGLGLYSVKKYLDQMGGEISVKSKVGEGSNFTVYIPFKIEKEGTTKFSFSHKNNSKNTVKEEKNAKKIGTIICSKNNVNAKKKKVLLVEDDKIVGIATQRNLIHLGCDVDWAGSGEEAVEKIKDHDYQLIFMDIGLPKMSGIDTAMAIRSLENKEKSNIPIVALTGHARGKSRKLCLDVGMQGVFSKPASLDDLRKALDYFSAL
jgi:PAS domain S-box-containing protein